MFIFFVIFRYFLVVLEKKFISFFLIISDNEIGAEGVKALSETLTENVTLQSLYLGYNDINDKAAISLAEGIKENPTLRELVLSSKFFFFFFFS